MAQNIDELQIEIQTDASGATSGLDNLVKSLEKLKKAVKGSEDAAKGLRELVPALKNLGKIDTLNLTQNVEQLKALNSVMRSINATDYSTFGEKTTVIADGLTKLAKVPAGKIPVIAESLKAIKKSCDSLGKLNVDFAPRLNTLGTSITSLSKSSDKLNEINFNQFKKNVSDLAGALTDLQGWKSQAASVLNALNGFPETAKALNEFTDFDVFGEKIELLAEKMGPLGKVSSKLGATLDALTRLPQVANGLNAVNLTTFGRQMEDLGGALDNLSDLNIKLGSTLNQLSRVGTVAKELNGAMQGSCTGIRAFFQTVSSGDGATVNFAQDIRTLVTALKPLETVGKSNLGTLVNQLKKIPEIVQSLDTTTLDEFEKVVRRLTEIVGPLADRLQGVYNGFSVLAPAIRRATSATEQNTKANGRSATSFSKLSTSITRTITKMTVMGFAFRRVWNAMADLFWVSSDYIENLNLFTVTMGDATEAALEYAQTVSDAMGIDISEWMQYQGTFQQLATGFGVASDQAAIMSQNLTQLSYDFASFYNTKTIEEAFDKISSAMTGQIKGLKEYGHNLSVAALQEYALSKGITQSVRQMSEKQKVILRYNLLMENATNAQGDLARTMISPANSVRILGAQLTKLKRHLGDIASVIITQVIPYVQAFVQIAAEAAEKLAALFGFELPEFDYSGLSNAFGDADEDADGLNDTLGNIKKQLMGFDELNILSDNSSSGSAGASGSDWDLELESYEFLGNLDTSKVDEIKEKLTTIAEYIPEIVIALGTLKLTKFITDLVTANMQVTTLKDSLALLGTKTSIVIGVTLAVTGFTFFAMNAKDAIQEGLDGENFAGMLGNGLAATGGSAIIGKFAASWITDAFAGSAVSNAIATAGANLGGLSAGATGAALAAGGAGILVGIPAMFVGIYDAIKNGMDWLSGILIPAGGAAAGAGVAVMLSAAGTAIAPGVGTLIGLAVGLLIDGIILLCQHWDTVATWFKEHVIEPVGGFFAGLWTGIQEIWGVVATWFDDTVIQPVASFFSSAIENIGDFFSDLWSDIKKIWSKANKWFQDKVVKPVKKTFSAAVDWIGTLFEGCWLIIKACWIVASTWFDENIIQPVVGAFQWLWSTVAGFFSQLWTDIKNIWSSVTTWFNEKIVQPVVGFFEGLWKDIGDFFAQLWIDIKGVWNSVATWFDEKVIQPVVGFFEDLWLDVSGFFSQLWTDIKGIWESVSEWFDKNVIQPIAKLFEGLWHGLHVAAVTAINAVIGAAEGLVNIIVDALNVVVGGFNVVVEWAADVCGEDWGGLAEFKRAEFKRLEVPQYAGGGLPAMGEMFIAKERGPELVGRIGNRSAVANNGQIITGIANGVYAAVSAAMRENGGGSNQRIEIRVPVQIGNRVLGEAVAEWNNGVVKQTGKSPLLV